MCDVTNAKTQTGPHINTSSFSSSVSSSCSALDKIPAMNPLTTSPRGNDSKFSVGAAIGAAARGAVASARGEPENKASMR